MSWTQGVDGLNTKKKAQRKELSKETAEDQGEDEEEEGEEEEEEAHAPSSIYRNSRSTAERQASIMRVNDGDS